MSQTSPLCGGALAFRVREALVRGWGYEYGHTDRCAQNGGTQVAGTAADEHTRTKPDTLKSAAVCAQRYFVVTTALDVIPGGWPYACLSEGLVITEVDGFHLGFLLVHKSSLLQARCERFCDIHFLNGDCQRKLVAQCFNIPLQCS